MPCRGSGQVISNLGGTPSTVTCPWCGGGGVRLPGIDAQAHWQGEQSASGARTENPSGTGEDGETETPEDGSETPAEPPSAA
jgi:hypothetical protein